jgi:hypothetical protein
MKNSFEPINLQSASRHIDWLINKTKEIYHQEPKKTPWQKFLNILTRIF